MMFEKDNKSRDSMCKVTNNQNNCTTMRDKVFYCIMKTMSHKLPGGSRSGYRTELDCQRQMSHSVKGHGNYRWSHTHTSFEVLLGKGWSL